MFILSFLLSFASAANFFPVGKPGSATNYAEQSACESAEGQKCFDTSACPSDECVIGKVDDLSRPKFLKRHVTECVASDCKSDLVALTCDEGTKLIAADLKTVYCAVPNGFEKMDGGLVRDDAKVAAKEVAKEQSEARAAKVAEGIRQQEVGRRIIAYIKVNLDEKNLSVQDSLNIATTISPIVGLLQMGSIPTAKAMVMQLAPAGAITQADLDLTLQQFAAEGY